jgi:arylsulfatase A
MNSIDRSPNIVFIMADDMGYGDVGCYNPESRIPTPHMDGLAAAGVRFTDAHSASSVCTPTRYAVLTGRDCWRSALPWAVLFNYEKPLIEPQRMTWGSFLRDHGYHTACIGKWHLGLGWAVKKGQHFDFDKVLPWDHGSPDPEEEDKIDFSKPISGGPVELGFDYFFGTSGASTAQPPYAFIEGEHMVEIPSVRELDPPPAARMGLKAPSWRFEDIDLVIAEKAVAYLEERSKAVGKPFFLYLCPSAPHEPCVESVVPDHVKNASEAGPRGDLVALFDWVVGKVVSALDRLGLADNTLLICTSDNGALPGHSVSIGGREPWDTFGHKSCGDWRGYKSHIWDGGHREPLIIRWPGKIEPNTVSHELISLNDLFPTCAAVLGERLPDSAAEDGYDMLPAILSEERGSPRDSPKGSPIREAMVHHSYLGVFSIRKGNWKLILDTKGSGGFPPPSDTRPVPGSPGQLYNLKEDPGEGFDLFDQEPMIVSTLASLLSKYQQSGQSAPPAGQ